MAEVGPEIKALIERVQRGDLSVLDFLAQLKARGVDPASIGVSVAYKLEKFEGEKEPGDGKEPIEVIEAVDDGPVTVWRAAEQ